MKLLERLETRGKDAVARCLLRHLSVPTVYFDARWPDSVHEVDVLAIDRSGVGDVHVVEVKGPPFKLDDVVKRLMRIPAQFRWLAYVRHTSPPRYFAKAAPQSLYPSKGMGRIGVIEIIRADADDLAANIRFKAERFPGNLSKIVDRFAGNHKPDIEFR